MDTVTRTVPHTLRVTRPCQTVSQAGQSLKPLTLSVWGAHSGPITSRARQRCVRRNEQPLGTRSFSVTSLMQAMAPASFNYTLAVRADQ